MVDDIRIDDVPENVSIRKSNSIQKNLLDGTELIDLGFCFMVQRG